VKVLFLAHRIPYPPNRGAKIRSYHELRALVARGHEAHLLAFAEDPQDRRHGPVLRSLCASASVLLLDRHLAALRVLAQLPGRAPLSQSYFDSPAMRRAVRHKLLKLRPDAIFVCSSAMAHYIPRTLRERAVVDLVDANSEKWRAYAGRTPPPLSWLYGIEWQRLRRWERTIVDRFAHTVVTTERELGLLGPWGRSGRPTHLHAITNGVDLDYYRPDAFRSCWLDSLPTHERRFLANSSAQRLLFTGVMDYYPNVEGIRYFVEDVLPLVRVREPRAELLIVGGNPTRQVRRLAEQPGVTVTGFVEDVRPYLAAAKVSVVPLRIARGVSNKILESMASGRPVAATPEAAASVHGRHGEHLLIGGDAGELAESVLRLLQDEPLRQRLALQARSFVETEYAWEPHLRRLAELVESVSARQAVQPQQVAGA
jgi:polysaccharide biosynthesis protein PslH